MIGLDELIKEGIKVDTVITSPPYNLNMAYPGVSDNLPDDKYLQWSMAWIEKITKLLKPEGSFFLNLGGRVSNSMLPIRIIRQTYHYFDLQNTIIWVKSIYIPEANTSFGHFKPVNSKAYLSGMHEFVFHLVTRGKKVSLHKERIAVPYADKSNVSRYGGGKDRRDIGNVWFLPYETKNASGLHPSAFPVSLPLKCLKLSLKNRNATVLDPFVGSGSTGVACARLGVKHFIGVDSSKAYIALATSKIGAELTSKARKQSLKTSYER